MQVLVNGINNENTKDKWNAAISSIKKDLHSLSNGLNVSSLNRIWAQFVKSYNRLINLLYELDRNYGQFQVPSSDYYDNIPETPLTTYKDFSVAVNLVYANINKIPKLNLPVLQIQSITGQLEADFRDFTRTYVATANKESAAVKRQQNDKEGHVTAFQNYIAKANSYATAEQREIAQEYMEQVYEDTLTETATQQAESLGDILTAIEDTIEAINNTGNRNDEAASNLDTAKSEIEDLIDKAGKAAEGFKEAKDALLEAGNAYNESIDAYESAYNDAKDAYDTLYEEAEYAGWMVDTNPGGGVIVTTRLGDSMVYDPETGTVGNTGDHTVYAYDETTGKWTNVDDPTDVADEATARIYDEMKDLGEKSKAMEDAESTMNSNKEALDKAQETYGAAETEYNEARDALDTATGGTTEYKELE